MVSDESIRNCYPRAYNRYAGPPPPDAVGQFPKKPNDMCMAFRDYLKDLWTMFSVVVSC